MAYFLISVSNRNNLNLCIQYAMAGFTSSINGAWTFLEIQKGDYISFLYGAKAYNLYQVKEKIAFKNAKDLPPWPPVTFSISGNTYYFPFRLFLKPIRKFIEPLVRAEFSFVAENLLLRGGYRKTHFQADQTTLQAVSQMGDLYLNKVNKFEFIDYETFELKFTRNLKMQKIPETFKFVELILQSTIRQYLSIESHMEDFLKQININLPTSSLEVLGEKAFPEGHIDILIKEAIPVGKSDKVILEVKTGKANPKDIEQVSRYAEEMGTECLKGILIALSFSDKVISLAKAKEIALFSYDFGSLNLREKIDFAQIVKNLKLKFKS